MMPHAIPVAATTMATVPIPTLPITTTLIQPPAGPTTPTPITATAPAPAPVRPPAAATAQVPVPTIQRVKVGSLLVGLLEGLLLP